MNCNLSLKALKISICILYCKILLTEIIHSSLSPKINSNTRNSPANLGNGQKRAANEFGSTLAGHLNPTTASGLHFSNKRSGQLHP